VERPGIGDQSRGWGSPFVGNVSAYFLAANRNKRSVVLNYDHAAGLEVQPSIARVPEKTRRRCANASGAPEQRSAD
jgi:crotonobetainyl-CoA:carnitine CoA-transferase CaiB-like acyl-CoA transferase